LLFKLLQDPAPDDFRVPAGFVPAANGYAGGPEPDARREDLAGDLEPFLVHPGSEFLGPILALDVTGGLQVLEERAAVHRDDRLEVAFRIRLVQLEQIAVDPARDRVPVPVDYLVAETVLQLPERDADAVTAVGLVDEEHVAQVLSRLIATEPDVRQKQQRHRPREGASFDAQTSQRLESHAAF